MRTERTLWMGLSIAVLAVAGLWVTQPVSGKSEDEQTHVYELRTYTTAEGRLPDLHKRFRDHTMELFEKHGIKNVAYWTPVDKDNTLVYVIAHESREAAKKSWKAFGDDPQWQKVFKESREDGPIVINVERQFLKPTDYSPKK